MNIGNKISEIRKSKNISLDKLSLLSGVSVSTLKKISAGITKDPQIDTLKAIAKALGCTLEDFDEYKSTYTIEEKNLISDYRQLDPHSQSLIKIILDHELERVHTPKQPKIIHLYHRTFYDIPASAGTGEPLDVSTAVTVELDVEPPRGTDYIIRISGNSMEPIYHDNDYIYVKKADRVNYGDIGIFLYLGSVYMKEYTPEGLRSLNPDYPLINGYEDIRCLGKVLGIVEGSVTEI